MDEIKSTDQALPVSTISRTKQGYRSAQENQGTDQWIFLILDQGLMEKTEVQINLIDLQQIKGTDQELYPRFDHKTGVQINPKNKGTDQEKPGKLGVQFNNELINLS